ncbi:MAG: pyridoxamine 5'-phosphate oxidase family protein [Rhizobacter sp.]
MQDANIVVSVEQLRAVIPAPSPVVHRKVFSTLDESARQFISESPLIFVLTSDRQFNIDVSPKGDHPGFVRIENPSTLLIPERPGNRLAYGFENLIETGSIGLIFLIPGVRETLRVNGTAVITRDPVLLQEFASNGKAALLCTRVAIKESFFHCGKALIRSKLWLSEAWRDAPSKDAAVKSLASTFGISEATMREKAEEDYRQNL